MSIAYKISGYNRRRKYQEFLKYLCPQATAKILDVGFTEIEYSDNDNFLEKNYPHQENVSALGMVKALEFANRYPKIKSYVYDGKIFPFTDKQFEIIWSNAVLEHVGSYEEQILFLKEIKRVGKQAFITTPNKNFPVEVHTRTFFLHFLPKRVFDFYLKLIGKSWATGSYMNLLTVRKLKVLLKKADINDYKIIQNRICGFVLDLVVVIK